MVEVAGFTDNIGNVALNQALSARRVNSVVAYVADKFNVPLRRFVNPTGLGETQPVGDNDTAEGRALNRRVEIKVLQNKGIAAADSSARRRARLRQAALILCTLLFSPPPPSRAAARAYLARASVNLPRRGPCSGGP